MTWHGRCSCDLAMPMLYAITAASSAHPSAPNDREQVVKWQFPRWSFGAVLQTPSCRLRSVSAAVTLCASGLVHRTISRRQCVCLGRSSSMLPLKLHLLPLRIRELVRSDFVSISLV